MFCKQCGAENADNAVFCKGCGAALTAAECETPVQDNGPAPEKGARRGLGLIAVVGAVVVAVVILLIVLLGSGGYKAPVKKLVSGLNNTDPKKIMSVLHKDVIEEMLDQLDMDEDDFADMLDEIDDQLDDLIDEWEDEYGDKIKISAKFLDAEDVSKKDLKQIKEDYDMDYDLKVKAAKDVKVKLTIKGKDGDENEKAEFRVVKIGGSWYLDASELTYLFY